MTKKYDPEDLSLDAQLLVKTLLLSSANSTVDNAISQIKYLEDKIAKLEKEITMMEPVYEVGLAYLELQQKARRADNILKPF